MIPFNLKDIIIYEDDQIMGINKPSGLIVNRSDTAKTDTLHDYLEEYLKITKNDVPDSFESRSGIVHRLDKNTSGVLVIAKNADIFANLQAQFKNREVQKEYKALLFGKLPGPEVQVDAPIGRDKKNRMRYAISRSGKAAFTHFTLDESIEIDGEVLSLVTVKPTTGRTHQIRVHSVALNTPVVGDETYSGQRRTRWAKTHKFFRMMLHAQKLSITLPYKNDEMVTFEALLPIEFTNLH